MLGCTHLMCLQENSVFSEKSPPRHTHILIMVKRGCSQHLTFSGKKYPGTGHVFPYALSIILWTCHVWIDTERQLREFITIRSDTLHAQKTA